MFSFGGAVQLQGVLWIRFGQQTSCPDLRSYGFICFILPKKNTSESTYVYRPGNLEMSSILGKKTLQKKALFKQNKGHLGSRIRSPWFFCGCVFPEGFVFFSAFFSDLQEGLRLVKDVDIDQPFSMHGW